MPFHVERRQWGGLNRLVYPRGGSLWSRPFSLVVNLFDPSPREGRGRSRAFCAGQRSVSPFIAFQGVAPRCLSTMRRPPRGNAVLSRPEGDAASLAGG